MKAFSTKYWGFVFLLVCFGSIAKAQPGICPPNIGFETGDFSNWTCRIGTLDNAGNVTWAPSTTPVANRHTILAAPGGRDFYGNFPVICPNGSQYSVKLGNTASPPGRQVSEVSYTFTVPATTTGFSMMIWYAVVLFDPGGGGGHSSVQRPRFKAKITDMTTNTTVPCVDFDFISSATLPGFTPSPLNSNVIYKDWTPVSINLSGLVGRSIKVELGAYDCTLGGHFGYAYVDVSPICNGVISGNTLCGGETSLTMTAPFGFQSYNWFADATFPLPPISTSQTLTMAPVPSVGSIFPVEVIPFPGFGCKDTLYAVIDIASPPVSDAGPDGTVCNNQTIQLGTASNPLYSYAWTWTPVAGGQLNNTTFSNPLASVQAATTVEYIVETMDLLTGCKSKDTTYITGRQADTTLTVNGRTNYCLGDPSPGTLSVNPTVSGVQWYDGATLIPGATGFTFQPTVSGSYWAQIIESGCTDSTRIINFTIGQTPVANAGPNASICTNQTIQIGSPPVAGVNYSWAPAGQVSNANIADPIAWVNDGTPVQFIVRATEALLGCYTQDTMYIIGRVVDTSLLVTGKTDYCTAELSHGVLTVSNTLLAVQWYDGATPIPGATGYSYQPVASGNYWAEIQQNGCTDSTRTIPFTVKITPVSNAGPDVNICANQTIQIGAAPVGGLNYSWTPVAQVNNATIANPQAWVNDGTPIEFIVRTTNAATGCYSQDTMYMTGRVVDTSLLVNGKTSYCRGDLQPGTLSVNAAVTAVQWYDGTTPIPGATGYSYFPIVSGNYWAQVQQFGCTDSTRTTVFFVHEKPLVAFSTSSDTGCVTKNTFIFRNNSTAPDGANLSYLWRFSDGITQTTTDAIRTFLVTGAYTVKLITTSEFGCADSTALKTVHVMPNGVADFRWDSICVNRPSLFYNMSNEKGSPQVNYSWNFNNGGPVVNVKDPGTVTYTTVGKVDVTLILTALGCENDPDTVIKKVQANVSKPGKQYKDITVAEGAKVFIHARDSIGPYFQWLPMIQLNNYNERFAEFTAINDVMYQIRISDIHTCVTIDTLQMLVLKKPGFYLPTAFTPNGDGLNDVAIPYLVRMKSLVSFSVFNRWGNRVFYTNQPNKGWDGKSGGVEQANGVYVWVLEFVDNNSKKVTEKGTITVIR